MTDMTVRQSTDMASIDAKLAARAAAMRENITVAGNNIAIQKNGSFKMPGGEERTELEAIILDYRYRNQFFPKTYRKGEFTPAACFAVGDVQDGMTPSAEAPEPQSTACQGCPRNEFGSALNGGKGKACQNQFLVAVMLPDLGESEEVYTLKASPTAAKALAGYVSKMVDTYGHPIKAVTRFTIDASSDYAKLQVAYGGPNAAYAAHADFLSVAERALEAVPKSGEAAPKDTTVAAGTGRQARERVS